MTIMKILICMKQVIDSSDHRAIRAVGDWLHEDRDTPFKANSYDEYALEEALILKESLPDVEIHVLTVGPERAAQVLRRALSKGADEGIHLLCERQPLSALETAAGIAGYTRSEPFDLILTGVMSEDAMQCQVGPMLAALLDLPCAVAVVGVTLSPDREKTTVASELEGLLTETIEITLPALLTIQSSEHRPRYPSLSNILRARRKQLLTLAAEPPAGSAPRQLAGAPEPPPAATKGVVLAGTRQVQADRLLDIFEQRSLLQAACRQPLEKSR